MTPTRISNTSITGSVAALALLIGVSVVAQAQDMAVTFKGETVYAGSVNGCPSTHPAVVYNRFELKSSVDLKDLHVMYSPASGEPSIEPVRTYNDSGEIVHTYCAAIGDKNLYKVRFYNSQSGKQSNVLEVVHPAVSRESFSKSNPEALRRVSGR